MAFVRMMNRRARELGLDDTHFSNPIGLDAPANYSSAHDLARLAIKLRRHSFIRRIANRTSATLSTGYRPRTIRNRNTLLAKDRYVNGLKTGHTANAGYVLVTPGAFEALRQEGTADMHGSRGTCLPNQTLTASDLTEARLPLALCRSA